MEVFTYVFHIRHPSDFTHRRGMDVIHLIHRFTTP